MGKAARYISILISILLGGVFLFSAYSKLYPIEPFEYTFVESGISGWKASIIVARLFIGFELACGVLLILNFRLRRFTIPLVSLTLIAFCIYLIIQIATFGNRGNCGCFGEAIHFTPLEGIIKNIVMLATAAFIYRFHTGYIFRGLKILTILLLIAALAMPFILNPVSFSVSEQHYGNKLNYHLDLDILYQDENNVPPKVELRKGKWIISFLSLTCPHCRVAAKKLHVMKIKNPELPIYMVLNGKKDKLKAFFDDTRADNLQWSGFNGPEKFLKLGGADLPSIVWVENSVVVNKTAYFYLSQQEIEKWLEE